MKKKRTANKSGTRSYYENAVCVINVNQQKLY